MSLATDKISGYLTSYERGDHAGSSKPSYTTQEVSDLLLRSHYSANGKGVTDHAAILTYSFPVYTGSDKTGAAQLTAAQQAQTKLSLQSWSDVANITFTEVKGNDAKNADIKFGFYKAASGGNYTSYESTQSNLKSTIWISGNNGYDASNPQTNNYARDTLTHEIGHALGLSHPGNYDASNATYPTYANSAKYYEDDHQYSLMSYFNEQYTSADYKGVWPSGPQLDDITAIQKLYGANTTTRTGDTTYGFNSNTDRDFLSVKASTDKIVAAIWDAGGNDTLDFSGYSQDQRININEGAFSDVGGLKANIAIAYGAQIENIIGGSGADILVGNALNNTLKGGAGNDIIYGAGGADQLWGNAGADTFVFREAGDSQAAAPDWIRDFQTAVDKIDLSWLNQTAKADGSELHFVDSLSGSLYEAALNYDAQQNVTDLAINLSGNQLPDFLVKIVGHVDASADILV